MERPPEGHTSEPPLRKAGPRDLEAIADLGLARSELVGADERRRHRAFAPHEHREKDQEEEEKLSSHSLAFLALRAEVAE
jgi:hypothetical protein